MRSGLVAEYGLISPLLASHTRRRCYDNLCIDPLRSLDLFGTAVFAMEGAVDVGSGNAKSSGMDLLGCVLVGFCVAVGGGTIRDLLLSRAARPFWIDDRIYIKISVLASAAAFFFWPLAVSTLGPDLVSLRAPWLVSFDAIALGTFAIVGTISGIDGNLGWEVSVLFGVMTGTFGGLVRDLCCLRRVRILHSDQELYATCAAIGSCTYLLGTSLQVPPRRRLLAGIASTCLARWAAVCWRLALPSM